MASKLHAKANSRPKGKTGRVLRGDHADGWLLRQWRSSEAKRRSKRLSLRAKRRRALGKTRAPAEAEA